MRIFVISDIHGRHEILQTGFDKFLNEGYEKIILLGDLADSYDRTNEDILRCFKMAFDMKDLLGDRMEWLIGNHELHYMFAGQLCSGFRPDLGATLNPWLVENRHKLKVAYSHETEKDTYLFSHAGVQRKWYNKHKDFIEQFVRGDNNLGMVLNDMIQTGKGTEILCEVGVKRGGMRYDYGGPFWCDKEEMESYGPIKGYHQVVGHTPQKFIDKVDKFEGGKHYNNTSVTFCDVLKDGKEPQFLTLDI